VDKAYSRIASPLISAKQAVAYMSVFRDLKLDFPQCGAVLLIAHNVVLYY
jgi:hypothetical protein